MFQRSPDRNFTFCWKGRSESRTSVYSLHTRAHEFNFRLKGLYSDVCSFGVTFVNFAYRSYFNSLSFLLVLSRAVGIIFCGAPLPTAGESAPLPSGSLHLSLMKS